MATIPSLKTIGFWLARLLLGGAFLYAGSLKALDPTGFATDVGHYRLLPHPLALMTALYLPWLEIICGLAVLARWRERGALLILIGLCGIFCVALASAWLRGLDITCGCFGQDATASSTVPLAFFRSLGLGLLGGLLLWRTTPAAK